MKSQEYLDKVRTLGWLKGIATQYREHLDLMDREKEHYTVRGIGYAARGDDRVFRLNPHRSIPYKYFYEGLKEALANVEAEIAALESSLKQVTVEL